VDTLIASVSFLVLRDYLITLHYKKIEINNGGRVVTQVLKKRWACYSTGEANGEGKGFK
jgi:hypothetical protein